MEHIHYYPYPILKDKAKFLTGQKDIANHFIYYFSGIADYILRNRMQ